MTNGRNGNELASATLVSRRTVLAGIISALATPTLLAEGWAKPASARTRQSRAVQPLPSEFHTTTQTGLGTIVAGGFYLGALSAVRIFDGLNWHEAPPMLTARYKHAAVPYGNGVLVIGGLSSSGQPLSDVELFDGSRWRRVGSMRMARSQHAAVTWNGSVLATGGIGLQPLSSAEMFDGTSWQPAPHLNMPRYGHTATIERGMVIVIGGSNRSPLNNSERFNGQEWTLVRA